MLFYNPSDVSGRLVSALKAKAPVVAIPVEGHAPVCVNRARLAGWSKGVHILTVEVEPFSPVEEFEKAKGPVRYQNGVYTCPEGPENRIVRVVGGRWLKITGVSGRNGHIRSTAKFYGIPRTQACKELSKWSAKEREKLEKKIMLGALSKDQRKALKRAKFEDDGEGMIPVMVAGKEDADPKTRHMGVPVSIPEMESLNFAVVRLGTEDNVSYSVTELSSGKAAGFGKTAEEAILNARQNARSVPAERLAEVVNELIAA